MNARPVFQQWVILAALVLSGCSAYPRPLMVQVCLRNDSEIDQLTQVLRRVSSDAGMDFNDRSEASQVELRRLDRHPGYRIVSVSAIRRDGLGLAAGNLGISGYEVAVGFTNSPSAAESAEFMDTVISELEKEWDVRPVLEGRGAVRSKDCQPAS